MEAIGQRYLFKLRQTAGVKRFIERNWYQSEWQNVGNGFHAVEDELSPSSDFEDNKSLLFIMIQKNYYAGWHYRF